MSFFVFSSTHAATYEQYFQKRCEDGDGKSCYEYGFHLQTIGDAKSSQIGAAYIRRACTMAFTPACTQKVEKPAPVAAGDPDVAALQKYHDQVRALGKLWRTSASGSRAPKMSVWERAGFRATPFLTKILGRDKFLSTGSNTDLAE